MLSVGSGAPTLTAKKRTMSWLESFTTRTRRSIAIAGAAKPARRIAARQNVPARLALIAWRRASGTLALRLHLIMSDRWYFHGSRG
jgi:hypothetical protein